MQGSARKDVVFGAARGYTFTVLGPKWKSWLTSVNLSLLGSSASCYWHLDRPSYCTPRPNFETRPEVRKTALGRQ